MNAAHLLIRKDEHNLALCSFYVADGPALIGCEVSDSARSLEFAQQTSVNGEVGFIGRQVPQLVQGGPNNLGFGLFRVDQRDNEDINAGAEDRD